MPTLTPSPTATWFPAVPLRLSEAVNGIAVAGVRYVWEFAGENGQSIQLQNNSVAMVFAVYTEDGVFLGQSEPGMPLEAVLLPETGAYFLLGYADIYGGPYTFILEPAAENVTASPNPG